MTSGRRTSAIGVGLAALLVPLVISPPALAYTVSGRVTLGSYVGTETLAQPSAGDNSNDVATVSGRFFLRAADLTDNRFELVTDIRDKNDFFGLVDKQRLQLTNANTLQARQLSFKYPGNVVFTQVGRFPVPEAGAVYTDGAMQGVVLSDSMHLAVFGGLNPKRPEQTYVQYNPNSQVYGAYLTYIPAYQPWGSSFSVDTAAVDDLVSGQTDRTYWYTNIVYQWGARSRLGLLTYLDFVPNTNLQNGTLNYQQALGSRWTLAVNLFSIDVIEYQRLQSVREQLPSSPYREGSAKVRFDATNQTALSVGYAYGHRQADGLERKEVSLIADFLGAFNRHWDLSFSGGYRDNFSSFDTFALARVDYVSKLWEVGLDEQYALENYKGGGPLYHPLISEISVSRIFENALYGTISFQDVADERVKILSTFVKVSYRFGSKEIPPIRDGEPPRGNL